MTARRWLLGLAPAFAATGALAAQPAPAGAPAAPFEAAKKIAECAGEKFEFAAGDPRPTKITLCSDKGATTADLVRMFESAAARIEKLDKLPQDRRAALVAQIKGKIIEVRARNVFAGPLPAIGRPPVIRPEIGPLPSTRNCRRFRCRCEPPSWRRHRACPRLPLPICD